MYNLYYSGENLLIFSFALGITCLFAYILKNNKLKNFTQKWFGLILSLLLIICGKLAWFENDAIITGLIMLIIVAASMIIFRKKEESEKKHFVNLAISISLVLSGAYIIFNYSSFEYFEFILVGILWFGVTKYKEKCKLGKLNGLPLLLTITIILGICLYGVGQYANYNTAHVRTNDYSVKLGKHSAWISGYATPNAKVKTFLDGEEITPAEKAGKDGYFEFKVYSPGKWTVKVTKNGKTVTDYTKVEKSTAWKKYQAKEEARKAKADFAEAYAEAADSLEDTVVDEYNAWVDSDNAGNGGYIDDTLKNVLKEHKKDIIIASADFAELKIALNKMKTADDPDYSTYHEYYMDLVELRNTTVNPPAGYIETFDNAIENSRRAVRNDIDEIEE